MKDLTYLEPYRERQTEKAIYGAKGDKHNGCFKVFTGGRAFFVIASNGGGWDHVSVSPKNQKRCPTWDEMCAIKDMFFEKDECVVQFHPAAENYINNHPYCLHLWRPTADEMPKPPMTYV